MVHLGRPPRTGLPAAAPAGPGEGRAPPPPTGPQWGTETWIPLAHVGERRVGLGPRAGHRPPWGWQCGGRGEGGAGGEPVGGSQGRSPRAPQGRVAEVKPRVGRGGGHQLALWAGEVPFDSAGHGVAPRVPCWVPQERDVTRPSRRGTDGQGRGQSAGPTRVPGPVQGPGGCGQLMSVMLGSGTEEGDPSGGLLTAQSRPSALNGPLSLATERRIPGPLATGWPPPGRQECGGRGSGWGWGLPFSRPLATLADSIGI